MNLISNILKLCINKNKKCCQSIDQRGDIKDLLLEIKDDVKEFKNDKKNSESDEYEDIKKRMKLEDKARKEIDDEKWNAELAKVHEAVGLKHYEQKDIHKMIWNTIISYLRLRKVKSICYDSNIITFILMRMLSSVFLNQLSVFAGGISVILFIILIINGLLCIWYLINPYVQQWPLLEWYSLVVVFLSYLLWIVHGLLRAASVEIENSKDKKHISMVFGVVSAIIIAICTTVISIYINY